MKHQNLGRAIGFVALGWLWMNSAFALEANEIFKRVDPSVVVIGAEGSKPSDAKLGSGVIVEALDVITSCHVVVGATRLTVKQGSVQRSAKLRYQDAARDLCQIHLDDSFPSGKPVSGYVLSKQLEVGQSVFAIGSPRGLEHTISRGIVSALREMKEEAGNLIQTDAAISPGSSGGGLFDAEGRLIGIVTFQFKDAQNLNFAIPADWIQELSKRNRDRLADGPPPQTDQGDRGRSPPDATTAGFLRVGDRWKYQITFGRQRVGTTTIEIIEASGRIARERITYDGSKGFIKDRTVEASFNPARFQAPVMLPGGYQLAELSPYADAATPFNVGQRWVDVSGAFSPQGGSTINANSSIGVAGIETVIVPAGQFKAWKIESSSDSIYAVSQYFVARCTYWYAPEMKRTVKMMIHYKSPTDAISSTQTFELLSFEPGK